MNKKTFVVFLMVVALLLGASIIPDNPLYNTNWALLSSVFLIGIFFFIYQRYEKQETSTKEIALIATMATLAAVARVPFAVVMSLQPTTFIVMISGYVFGRESGFMIGSTAAFVSNLFLGQGPWTPWQMFCWGLGGFVAGHLGRNKEKINYKGFLALTFAWGYIYGSIMTVWHWLSFVYPNNWTTFVATYAASFPFDTVHATGNFIFGLFFAKSFFKILKRFKQKFKYEIIDGN